MAIQSAISRRRRRFSAFATLPVWSGAMPAANFRRSALAARSCRAVSQSPRPAHHSTKAQMAHQPYKNRSTGFPLQTSRNCQAAQSKISSTQMAPFRRSLRSCLSQAQDRLIGSV